MTITPHLLAALSLIASVHLAQTTLDGRGAPSTGASSPAAPAALTPTAVDAASRITAVTVFGGRAAVTRTASIPMGVGLYDVRFGGLPDAIDATSLQSRIGSGGGGGGGGAKVIGVDYAERPVVGPADPAVAELDGRIEAGRRTVAQLQEDLALVAEQEKLVAAIGVRVGGDASERVGSPQLDLDALRRQIDFVGGQRAALLATRRELGSKIEAARKALAALEAERSARAGKGGVAREAIVSVAATAAGTTTVELTYLVTSAGWTPVYNVRGALDAAGGGTATVEYDAMIAQRSGEDWEDVVLTLSTAQPTMAANPPTIQPWFVDVQAPPPPPAAGEAGYRMMAPAKAAAPAEPAGSDIDGGFDDQKDKLAAIERLSAAAAVTAGGPAVSYLLPRTVTVRTNADRMQRSRIATLDATPEFVHLAVPLLTESVYLRGTLVNGSAFLLLPGQASVFLANDYIGPTTLDTVAPGATFDVFFGIDRGLAVRRTLLSKTTEKTGLFGGGVRVVSDHRIDIDNPTGRPAKVEVLDRMPVSRNDQIGIELSGPSVPLSTDAEYLRDERPQGILRWDVTVPAGSTGPRVFSIAWGVRVSHGKDVRTTGLPE